MRWASRSPSSSQRFGGSDFIQVDYKGDLKDPAVAARLLRLTDLL